MNLQEVLIPEDGFIPEYIETVKGFNDAPLLFHLFSALIIIGASIGGKVWVPFGKKKIFPNLFICLLSRTGKFRKTECIENVRLMLKSCDEELIVPDEYSMESLVEKLNKKADCLFLWPEFSAVLSYFNRQYMAGAKEMFTRFYDCPQDYKRRLKSGEVKIRQVIPSILAGSTKEWLFRHMTEADLLGGFFGRFLYVMADRREKFMPLPPYVGESWVNKLVPHLEKLREIEGPVDLGKTTAAYEEFANKIEMESEKSQSDEFKEAFYVRIPVSVLKFALIYNLSMDLGLKISSEAMTKAILLGGFLKGSLEKAIEEELALTYEMRNKMKVLAMIRREPGITHGKLLKNSHLTSHVLKSILDQLKEEERLYVEGRGDKGNPWQYFAKRGDEK
jgi:hypothetical protein